MHLVANPVGRKMFRKAILCAASWIIPTYSDRLVIDALLILDNSDVMWVPAATAIGAMSEDAMQCARTVSFLSATMMAVTVGEASNSAEKGGRLKPVKSTPSEHVLLVPLDAKMTPPIFSISWWSRVRPTSDVNPPGSLFRETKQKDAEYGWRAD
ncbi:MULTISPECIES: hypothetical protein [Rhizobium]|nr:MULTISPECIES: hypothetical protein [Rhizobium]